jgi:hypothetical protein
LFATGDEKKDVVVVIVVGFIRELCGNVTGVSVGLGTTPGFVLGIRSHELEG